MSELGKNCVRMVRNLLVVVACMAHSWEASAQPDSTFIDKVRDINTSDLFDRMTSGAVLESEDIAFPPEAGTILKLGSGDEPPVLVFVNPGAGADDPDNLSLAVPDPISIAFDGKLNANRPTGAFGLFYYDDETDELVGVRAGEQGRLDPRDTRRFALSQAGIAELRGSGLRFAKRTSLLARWRWTTHRAVRLELRTNPQHRPF